MATTTSRVRVIKADRNAVTVMINGVSDHCSWAALEAAAAQDDREYREAYARILAQARQMRAETEKRQAREAEMWRVQTARQRTAANSPWEPITSWEVPDGIRFDTLKRDQGQIVQYSYGTFGAAEAGSCDPYMRVIDHSDGSCMFYRRRG